MQSENLVDVGSLIEEKQPQKVDVSSLIEPKSQKKNPSQNSQENIYSGQRPSSFPLQNTGFASKVQLGLPENNPNSPLSNNPLWNMPQVDESKLTLDLKGGKVPESVKDYNKAFENITGIQDFNLKNAISTTDSTLDLGFDEKRKNNIEEQKYKDYKRAEEGIKQIQQKIYYGAVKTEELQTAMNNDYSKRIIGDAIAPFLDGENIAEGNIDYSKVADKIFSANKKNAASAQQVALLQEEKDVSGEMANLFPELKVDFNDTESISNALQEIKGKYEGAISLKETEKRVPYEERRLLPSVEGVDDIVNKSAPIIDVLQRRLMYNQSLLPISNSVQEINDKIDNAVISNLNQNDEGNRDNVADDETKQEQFKLGLSYIEKDNPGLFKAVTSTLKQTGKIAPSDFYTIANTGQAIYNQKVYTGAPIEGANIPRETNFDYTTREQRKSDIASVIGEVLKNKQGGNGLSLFGLANNLSYSEDEIKNAAKDAGIDPNNDIVKELVTEEKLFGYDAIPKSGFVNQVIAGGAEVIKPSVNFVSNLINKSLGRGETTGERYLRTKSLSDIQSTGQQVTGENAEVSTTLPSERKISTDIYKGLGQFAAQILLTKGVGAPLEAGAKGLASVIGKRIGANAARGIVDYGGTYLSMFGQSYDNSYDQYLQSTGDEAIAQKAGFIDANIQALTELILPDVKIARRGVNGLREGLVSDLQGLVKKGGDVSTLLKESRKPFEKFISGYTSILATEIGEEEAGAVGSYLNRLAFDPNAKTEDSSVLNDAWNVAKSTALSMALPALFGAGGGAFQEDFTQKSLHHAAINIDDYKTALESSLAKNYISQDNFNKSVQLLNTHRESLQGVPEMKADGRRLTSQEDLDYALETTKIKYFKDKQEKAKTAPEKEMYDSKIKESENIQRNILSAPKVENATQEGGKGISVIPPKTQEEIGKELPTVTPDIKESAPPKKEGGTSIILPQTVEKGREMPIVTTTEKSNENVQTETKNVPAKEEAGAGNEAANKTEQPAEENLLSQAKDLVNNDVVKGFTAGVLKDAANNNPTEFKQHLKDISEQANDPKSNKATVDTYGKELVYIAQKLNPVEAKAEEANTPTTTEAKAPVIDKKAREGNAGILRDLLDESSIDKESSPLTFDQKENVHKAINAYEDGKIEGEEVKKVMLDNGLTEDFISRNLSEQLLNERGQNLLEAPIVKKQAKAPKEQPVSKSLSSVDNPALKDVESTAKALESVINSTGSHKKLNSFLENELDMEKENPIERLPIGVEKWTDKELKQFPITRAYLKYKNKFKESPKIEAPFALSEAYHKAKQDNSNPELVKAVEDLLGNKTEQKTEKKEQPKEEVKPSTEKPKKEKKIVASDKFKNKYKGFTLGDIQDADLSKIKTENGSQTIGNYISKAKLVLNQLFPDATFETYNTHNEFEKAGGIEGSRGVAKTEADGSKRILLNLKQMEEDGVGKTAFHEVIHPIVYDAFGTTPEELIPIWNEIANTMRDVEGMDKVWSHIIWYSDHKTPVEGITEFLTQVADGNINIEDIPATKQNKLIDLINRLFEKLGIGFKIEQPLDLKKFATDLKNAFETGDVSAIKETIDSRSAENKNATDNASKVSNLLFADQQSDKEAVVQNMVKDVMDEGFESLDDIKEAITNSLGIDSPAFRKMIEDAYEKVNPQIESGNNKPPIEPPVKNTFTPNDEEGNNLKQMALDIPNDGVLREFASKGTIEKYHGETPENEQTVVVQELRPALQHGENIIERAKEIYGDNYVDETLRFLDSTDLPTQSKALMYISLENDLARQKKNNPNSLDIQKKQDLVRSKSQAFLRGASLAINFGKLRKIGEVGYDINKITDNFFSSKEKEERNTLQKSVEANANEINRAAEEKEVDDTELQQKIDTAVESEINKIYEKLPTARRIRADKAIEALENFQKRIRSKAYDATIGIPVAIIDSGITVIKRAIKAGVNIADAIELGIQKIKERHGKEWAKEGEFRSDMINGFREQGIKKEASGTPNQVVKGALIEAGFGREISIKTKDGSEKRNILDWKKLAGEEGSIERMKENVAAVLENQGYTKEEISDIQNDLTDQYNDIRASVIEKSINELNRRNKKTITQEQKSAAKKLSELYNYGLFDKDPLEYDILLSKAVGIDRLNPERFKKAYELGKALETLYSSKFNGRRLNDLELKSAIQNIEEKMRIILHDEAQGHGSTALKIADITRTWMDATQRMVLNSLGQAVQNPLSAFEQTVISNASRMFDNSSTPELRKQRRKVAAAVYKDMVLAGGVNYGDVNTTFVSRGNLDAYIAKMSDNKIFHAIASTAIGKTTLDASDSFYKAKLTEQQFTHNLIKILSSERLVNGKRVEGMTKGQALNYVAEKLTGQSYKEAQKTAKEIIDKVNSGGKKIVGDSEAFVNRLANDIVKAALVNGSVITPEQVSAAYYAAYKSAGRNLGHVANNPLSEGVQSVSAKIEKRINDAIKDKEYRKAALLTYQSIFFRNILNPFVGGGTNWVVLKLEKNGLGLASGLYNGGKTKLDLSTESGLRQIEKSLYEEARNRDAFMRGAIGGAVSVLMSVLWFGVGGSDDDDEYRRWRNRNRWATKYLDYITPEAVLATLAARNKEMGYYVGTLVNKNESYDKGAKIIRAIDNGVKGKTDRALGQFGEATGGIVGLPLPWRLVRDIQNVWLGAKGENPYRVSSIQSKGFWQGALKVGMIDYIINNPAINPNANRGEYRPKSGSRKKTERP